MIKEASTGRIVGHMVEVTQFPGQLLQAAGSVASVINLGVSLASFAYMRSQFNALNKRLDRLGHKVDAIDEKLDALVGMVQRVDAKVDVLGHALGTLGARIDSRYRNDVFAELGAVLDTLEYADRKSPQDASLLVMSNITPARKALRRFASLVDEYEESLAEGDLGMIETIRMRFLLSTLSLKIDLVLGEKESALHKAAELRSDITERIRRTARAILLARPLRVLAESMKPDSLVHLCRTLEVIDGVAPVQRLAASFAAPAKVEINIADRGSFTTLVMECGCLNDWDQMETVKKDHKGPVILCGHANHGVGEMAGVSNRGPKYWRFDGKLKKVAGDSVQKGEPLLDVYLYDVENDRRLLSAEMVSPIDGTLIEDLTLAIPLEKNGWGLEGTHKQLWPWTGVCRVEPDLPTRESGGGDEVDFVAESIGTLARLNAAANGIALETNLLVQDVPLEALAQADDTPFAQEYFLVAAAAR
jgi:hypothetical protein